MELWDLYDKDRRPLGRTHQRGLPVPPGAYHLAVIVVILNPKGEVLLTRRAPEKDACPGWWENTGGSVLAGRPPWRPSPGSCGRRRASPPSRRSSPCCCGRTAAPTPTLTSTPSPGRGRRRTSASRPGRRTPPGLGTPGGLGGRGRHRGHPLPRPERGVQTGAVPPHRPVFAGPAGVFLKGGTLCQSCGTCMISTVDL